MTAFLYALLVLLGIYPPSQPHFAPPGPGALYVPHAPQPPRAATAPPTYPGIRPPTLQP